MEKAEKIRMSAGAPAPVGAANLRAEVMIRRLASQGIHANEGFDVRRGRGGRTTTFAALRQVHRAAVLLMVWLCTSAGAQTGAFDAKAGSAEAGVVDGGSVTAAEAGPVAAPAARSVSALSIAAMARESEGVGSGLRNAELAHPANAMAEPPAPFLGIPLRVAPASTHGCQMSGEISARAVPKSRDQAQHCYGMACLHRFAVSIQVERVDANNRGCGWLLWASQGASHRSRGYILASSYPLVYSWDGVVRDLSDVTGDVAGLDGNSRNVSTMSSGEYHLHLYAVEGYVSLDQDSWTYHDVAEAVGRVKLDDNDRVKHAIELDPANEVGDGEINYEGDVDWWKFTIPADLPTNRVVTIETVGDTDTFGLQTVYEGEAYPDASWYIDRRDDDSGEGRNFRIQYYVSGNAGVDYVRVSHASPNGTGDYTLRVTGLEGTGTSGGDDHGDSQSAATRVSLPSQTSGEIDPGDDEDYFRFEVSDRGEVLARTTGGLDTVGTLYDADGRDLVTDDDRGADRNFLIRRQLDAGTYYVRVSSYGTRTGAYTLHMSSETGGGSPDLAVGSLAADRREVDPGERFTLSATVRNRGDARSSATTILYYRTAGSRDTLIGRNSIGALAPSGTASDDFRARAETAPGTYAYKACVTEVSGESNTANNCGSPVDVRVRQPSGGGDDHGDSRSAATRVSLPSQTSGEIDPGDDEDYFRFDLSRRGAVVVLTSGSLDTLGTLYDSGGRSLQEDDDSGADRNFRMARSLGAGVYYVRVRSRAGRTGRYTLHLSVEEASAVADTGGVGYRRLLGDFNGDGRDDVLLRHANGRWHYYPMNGRTVLPGAGSASLTGNPTVSVAGIGDLNGDGRDDVLVRRANGTWYYYPMDGRRSLSGRGEARLTSNLAWSVVGMGDFNGDGRDDVLLRHTNGRWHYYPMNGRTVLPGAGSASLTGNPTVSVAGIGDLNGDGRDDVLVRRANGTWYYYPMDGRRSLSGRGEVRLTSNLAWSVAGIGDFNGDGRDDVLLRHANGRWHYYPMNGRTVLAGAGSASLTGNPTVSVAGIGDLNGDGRDDVLVRRANGTWYYYPMDGRRSLAGRGEARLTSNLAWGGLLRTGGAGGTNSAPMVATAIPNRSLATGGDGTLDLSAHFSDDQALVYEVRSSDAEVLRVSVTDSVLTLMPVAEGSATVTVTARDPDGNVATQTFSVTVGASGGGGGGGQAGERFRDCDDVCPEMVVVPAGTFMMGAPESEVLSQDTARPVHAVSVPSFAMGVYEVTFDEWDACLDGGGCGGYRPSDKEWGRGRRPVLDVSWVDAQLYVEWLSSRTGERYRLPSESEWEYAARAGTTTPFHTGETITPDQANYDGTFLYPQFHDRDPNGVYREQTLPVGSFGANAWGMYDMHGNLWEWVADCWNYNYRGAPVDGSAWLTGICSVRVSRGGSWLNEPSGLRAALRYTNFPGFRDVHLGFRVARTLSP